MESKSSYLKDRIIESLMEIISTSDVLSFYKEELANDQNNLINFISISTGTPKIDVLKQLTEEALECDREVMRILEGTGDAGAEASRAYGLRD